MARQQNLEALAERRRNQPINILDAAPVPAQDVAVPGVDLANRLANVAIAGQDNVDRAANAAARAADAARVEAANNEARRAAEAEASARVRARVQQRERAAAREAEEYREAHAAIEALERQEEAEAQRIKALEVDNRPKCCICGEKQSDDSIVLVNSCQHTQFCKICIVDWLDRKSTCPPCRADVTEVIYDYEISFKTGSFQT